MINYSRFCFLVLEWTILKRVWWFYHKNEISNVRRVEFSWRILMRKKCKMATEIVQILDFFLRKSLYSDIQSPCFCKWPLILNWSKWILLTDILTHILITIMVSIDPFSRCKLNVCVIPHTRRSEPCTTNWYISQNL